MIGLRFSLGTPVSSTNKTDFHDITEILFKVALNTINHILFNIKLLFALIKDEVLLMVGCPIFPPFYIDSQISVHRKFKKIDQLIFRNANEIYFNEKFPIL